MNVFVVKGKFAICALSLKQIIHYLAGLLEKLLLIVQTVVIIKENLIRKMKMTRSSTV